VISSVIIEGDSQRGLPAVVQATGAWRPVENVGERSRKEPTQERRTNGMDSIGARHGAYDVAHRAWPVVAVSGGRRCWPALLAGAAGRRCWPALVMRSLLLEYPSEVCCGQSSEMSSCVH